MKLRALNILVCLFITACAITSCLDDDSIEYEFSSNASITSFAIKDSIITYYDAVVNDVDTTLSKGIVGSDYPFVIDQHNGRIYNPDSLPVGTDVSKVVIDVTIDGYNLVIAAETDSVWEETDSLNFTEPIKFKVLSQANTFGRTYTAQINVHKQEPEEMSWQKLESNFAKVQAQKAVYANGNIYVFAEQETQVGMTMATMNDANNWTALQDIDIPVKADYSSVMLWNESLYILAEDGMYTSTNGLNWNKVETSQSIARLLASIDGKKILGADIEGNYMESADGINWTTYENLPEGFPKAQTAFESYVLDTNDGISRVVLLEQNEEKTDSVTSAWMQLDTENTWSELSCEKTNFACPRLENAAMIRYNGKLYTFGGPGQRDGAIDAFSSFFQSSDNGISWEIIKKNLFFPEQFKNLYEEANGNYSYIVDDNHFIWIMWGETGEVWRGRINKLGFERK